MNRRSFLGLAAAGLGGLAVPRLLTAASLLDRGERLVERWSWAMGQPVHLTIFADTEDAGLEAASLALAELRRVEAALSLFDPASDLVALNERAGRGPVRVGPDLLAVLRRSEAFRALTRGAFDPAVEPLMRAWGFHAPRAGAPTIGELASARRAVKEARIKLGTVTASLLTGEARLDLGGIGVGYGLDRAAAVLRKAGIQRALLDVSGDIVALGAPPGRAGWEVDIMTVPGPASARSVTLRDAAVATSSNAASVVRYGDIVSGHIMDPDRGTPAHALSQVSVVAATATEADALSTAMLVSGRRARWWHRCVGRRAHVYSPCRILFPERPNPELI